MVSDRSCDIICKWRRKRLCDELLTTARPSKSTEFQEWPAQGGILQLYSFLDPQQALLRKFTQQRNRCGFHHWFWCGFLVWFYSIITLLVYITLKRGIPISSPGYFIAFRFVFLVFYIVNRICRYILMSVCKNNEAMSHTNSAWIQLKNKHLAASFFKTLNRKKVLLV